ncbi:uncharacterized protein GLRG_01879 [Colletotrichum graminicola M1.001]|uniref:Protein kinase domain-containing protein n=1 Tax=Colletotrichum graminicola (strain M1.001 / M2 / FGSC 10212) TaxID=645133 RepID=E3Q9K5_COLGM|nr:uncharacterized protein GLRG_01879 [Colletotrichum graminicola M1.001]EFQ27384.1 hypothetical protein GLRG_01879 [Colletotrichum graminicola M1.001]
MVVEIVRMIGGAPDPRYKPGTQKLCCRVIEAPSTSPWENEHKLPDRGQLLFLKIFDPLFWHKVVDITERSVKVTIQADKSFSDEFGAYHLLYKRNLTRFNRNKFISTGYSPIAPQFYGGWTATVSSVNQEVSNRSRKIAVLAVEYVDGVCLQDLFGPCGPVEGPVQLYENTKYTASFTTDQHQRMQIMAQLIERYRHARINHCGVSPNNVIISMPRNLDKPRAVLVDYGRAIIDKQRTYPAEFWKHFPTKHHPFLRFGHTRLEHFRVWVPLEWRGPPDDLEHTPLLYHWMMITFGGLVDNPNYTVFAKFSKESMPKKEQP